jgi:hypothetical protein
LPTELAHDRDLLPLAVGRSRVLVPRGHGVRLGWSVLPCDLETGEPDVSV